MTHPNGTNRRDFLRQSAAAAVAGLAGCASTGATGRGQALAADVTARKAFGPDNKIGVGFIAVGRRARSLIGETGRAIAKGAPARIVAISDVNKERLAKIGRGKPWKKYQDYREMLKDPAVDAVVISTPDHWHALNAIDAMKAGKDVYCEKPMTLTIREGRLMAEAARKYNRVFQTGSQQRSMKECRHGCELIRNGRIGKIKIVHADNYPSPLEKPEHPAEPVPEGLDWDMWCGPTEPRPYNAKLYLPRPHPTGWISYRPYSGGEMTGWGAHGLDMIQWALGTDLSGPTEVWPVGKGLKGPVVFRYDNGVEVHCDDKGPGGGGVFEGEKGKILIGRRKCQSWPDDIAKGKIGSGDKRLYRSHDHMGNWFECIVKGTKPICDVEIGHRSSTMCHLGNIARWTGRKLKWDPEKEVFIGDNEANDLIDRKRRGPYTL